MLVTVLADSLVTRGGFNVIAPGTNSPDLASDWAEEVLERSRTYVWATRPFMRENLRLSLERARVDTPESRLQQAMARVEGEPTLESLRQKQELLATMPNSVRAAERAVKEEVNEIQALAARSNRLWTVSTWTELSCGEEDEDGDDADDDDDNGSG
ncbi:diphenol oxidase [Apiospora arundinis]